jgi:hypothetical protein
MEQVRLTRAIYVKSLASRAPIANELEFLSKSRKVGS